MKKIIASIIAGTCLTFTACSDFLYVSDELASNLTMEQAFSNVKYTKGWHANIFNCISQYSHICDNVTGFTMVFFRWRRKCQPWYCKNRNAKRIHSQHRRFPPF